MLYIYWISSNLYSLLQEKCFQYWPHERSVRYQYYVVDPIAEYNMPQYKLREFKVSHTISYFLYISLYDLRPLLPFRLPMLVMVLPAPCVSSSS